MKKIIYSVMMLAMAAFTFTSCEDVPMPYDMPGYTSDKDEPIAQLVGDGTVENPYNVASALYLITEGKTTDEAVAVEGIISQIDEIDTGFGNATYYISDDGTTAKQLEVFRGYSLNGDRFKDKAEIKVGDKVIIYGQLVYYNQKTP
ncbi:MAG: DNA-binding protein, partial [Prevotella sp.]|nr:DNA-binding protein [Prevotella sp.]